MSDESLFEGIPSDEAEIIRKVMARERVESDLLAVDGEGTRHMTVRVGAEGGPDKVVRLTAPEGYEEAGDGDSNRHPVLEVIICEHDMITESKRYTSL